MGLINEELLSFAEISNKKNVTFSSGEFMNDVTLQDFLDYAKKQGVPDDVISWAVENPFENTDIYTEDSMADKYVWTRALRGLWKALFVKGLVKEKDIDKYIQTYTKDFCNSIKVVKQIENYESNYEKRKKEADTALDGLQDYESMFDWLGFNVRSILLRLPDNHKYDYQLNTRFRAYIPANDNSGVSWSAQAYPSLAASFDRKAFKKLMDRAEKGSSEQSRENARRILSDLQSWRCDKFNISDGKWYSDYVFDATTCRIDSIIAVMELLEKCDFHPLIKKDVWKDDDEDEE